MPDPRDASPVILSPFEKKPVDPATFARELERAVEGLRDARVPHLLIGGVAGGVYGRPLETMDIDFFVRPDDADRAIEALRRAGFDTERTAPHWLYKAHRSDVVIDVIFCSSGDVYLDEEMLSRARDGEAHGVRVRLISPEDLIVLKALAHSEPTSRYWFDALAVLPRSEIDWPYLIERARHGPKRILSLLVFAQSIDLPVPASAIRAIRDLAFTGSGPAVRAAG